MHALRYIQESRGRAMCGLSLELEEETRTLVLTHRWAVKRLRQNFSLLTMGNTNEWLLWSDLAAFRTDDFDILPYYCCIRSRYLGMTSSEKISVNRVRRVPAPLAHRERTKVGYGLVVGGMAMSIAEATELFGWD